MERITYRITLDSHRNGIQRTLQGFETSDTMSRRIAVNLVASGDTVELPLSDVVAMMYVTTPNATEPSINACEVDGNTIIYDVLPIVEEGITEMQLKVIETDPKGAKKVLAYPRFAVEVWKSGTDDDKAEQTTTFTALEDAVARANAVYDHRLLSIEVTEEYVFRASYADGTVYESDSLKNAFTYNGIVVNAETMINIAKNNAMLSESYAVGNTGIREGENTDNAKYYNNAAHSTYLMAKKLNEDSTEIMEEVVEKSVYTTFSVNFETGQIIYLSQNYKFAINEEGELEFEGQGKWSPTDETKNILYELIRETKEEMDAEVKNLNDEITSVKREMEDNIAATLESLGLSAVDGMLCITYSN